MMRIILSAAFVCALHVGPAHAQTTVLDSYAPAKSHPFVGYDTVSSRRSWAIRTTPGRGMVYAVRVFYSHVALPASAGGGSGSGFAPVIVGPGDLSVSLQTDSKGAPSGTLVTADAKGSVGGPAVPPLSTTRPPTIRLVTVTLDKPVPVGTANYWIVLSSAAGTYTNYAYNAGVNGHLAFGATKLSVSGKPYRMPFETLGSRAVIKVGLMSFGAERVRGGVQLAWTTSSELSCGAFSLLRCTGPSCTRDGYAPLQGVPSVPCLDRPRGASYQLTDPTAAEGVAHSYMLRETESTGGVNDYGPVMLGAHQTRAQWTKPSADGPSSVAAPGVGCSVAPSGTALGALAPLLVGLLVGLRRRVDVGKA